MFERHYRAAFTARLIALPDQAHVPGRSVERSAAAGTLGLDAAVQLANDILLAGHLIAIAESGSGNDHKIPVFTTCAQNIQDRVPDDLVCVTELVIACTVMNASGVYNRNLDGKWLRSLCRVIAS